jgi:hypothetical protein
VADLKIINNDVVYWHINFIGLVHDWEVDFVPSFFNVLYSIRVGRGGDYILCWRPLKRRSFEVKSFYKVLLPKVNSFTWKKAYGGLSIISLQASRHSYRLVLYV